MTFDYVNEDGSLTEKGALVTSELNDLLRKGIFSGELGFESFHEFNTYTLSSGVHDLLSKDGEKEFLLHFISLSRAIGDFNDFNESNDPYSEHDFGAVDFLNSKVFWKISYYKVDRSNPESPTLIENHSDNCADPLITARILSIMLDCEY